MMPGVAAWSLEPCTAKAGQPGPIVVRNTEALPPKQTVCVIPGGLARRLLDENEVRNARLTAAALRMHQALSELLRWAEHMGGWDSPCWAEARVALEAARQG